MKFEEALPDVRKGNKIYVKDWGQDWYDMFNKNIIKISLNQILYCDWQILEEPGKTFPEVFESFKDGKRIRRKIWWEGQAKGMISTKPGTISIDDLLATDWEICE